MNTVAKSGSPEETETIRSLRNLLDERILVIDGALTASVKERSLKEEDFRGEAFQSSAKPLINNSEVLSVSKPDVIAEIYKKNLDAGADIIVTNTFGASSLNLAEFGLEKESRKIVDAAVAIALKAADNAKSPIRKRYVAGAIGNVPATAAADKIAESISSLTAALVEGGVDALYIETVFGTPSSKAVIQAVDKYLADSGKKLPVLVASTPAENSVASSNPFSVGLIFATGDAKAAKPQLEKLNAGSAYVLASFGAAQTAPVLADLAGLVNIVGTSAGATQIKLIADGVKSLSPRALDNEETKKLADTLKAVSTSAAIAPYVQALTAFAKKAGPSALTQYGILFRLTQAASDAKNVALREAAMQSLAALATTIGKPAEPYLVPTLPFVFKALADKQKPVATAAEATLKAIVSLLSPNSVRVVLPMIFEAIASSQWQSKVGGLQVISTLSKTSRREVGACLPEIEPRLVDVMGDTKEQVRKASIQATSDAFMVAGNRDIEPFIPALVGCIANPPEVPECIHKLAATTFVQAVEAPCLSIIVPLLVRGLKERPTAIKRKTAVIIDNMAKLVDNPADASPFLPKLLPALTRASDEVSDPECRQVCTRALATLKAIQADIKEPAVPVAPIDLNMVLNALKTSLPSTIQPCRANAPALQYIAQLCSALIVSHNFDLGEWSTCITPYLPLEGVADAPAITESFLNKCIQAEKERAAPLESTVEEDEGEDLCNCTFSLAYGAKILLNQTVLHMRRGRRYGLCGANGTGKSTLMRAIANGQVEGFPPKEVLKTVYVEHDLDSSVVDNSVYDFIVNDEALKGEDKGRIITVLNSVGFDEKMRAMTIASLSGGWKMKLALARAMLMRADILLLDEPTNHLDVTNVKWLEGYLNGLTDVTCMIVSHDSSFLDHVCTNIIHLYNRKLRIYRGNLSMFIKKFPEAQSYYDLAATPIKFILPEPGYLEGVKDKNRAILKMNNVSFAYPNTTRKIIQNTTLQVTLSSRVGCTGPNGAGKSTLIKLLTGEVEVSEGNVWKHPNLRVAYVAQHAFHHLEEHLDWTPNEYIQWRYAMGEDRENAKKVTVTMTPEEEEEMKRQLHMVNGSKKQVEELVSRRKLKKSYEYEVKWLGLGPENNSYLAREVLEQMGLIKLINQIDAREAAAAGLVSKPLTALNIQKFLDELGLEAEFSTHSRVRGLSGGQKVKCVLGAAMWNNPHILVLDEPTNYLDRDSLGALALGIKEYGGGVVIISHNAEFLKAICPETWAVADGKVVITGGFQPVPDKASMLQKEIARPDEVMDALGNVIKVKAASKKDLSRKEQKQRERMRKARRDRGEVVSEDEDD